MAYDSARDRIVLFGGAVEPAGNPSRETWEFDGSVWMLVSTQGPAERSLHAMAFHDGRQKVIMMGGTPGGGTWEWDGQAWLPITIEGPAVHSQGMAYDSARGVMVACLGQSGSFPTSAIWELESGVWSLRGTYAALLQPAVVFHQALGQTIIVCGTPNFSDDPVAWVGLWNGSATTTGPTLGPGRFGAAIAYDSVRGRAVVFGGDRRRAGTSEEYLGDAQALATSTAWTTIASGNGPSPRARAAMVYDSVRDRMVLFGGRGYTGLSGETWVLSSPPSSQITEHPHGGAFNSGSPLALTIGASSTGGLTYSWRRDSQVLMDGERVSGASTPMLTIDPVLLSDAGAYQCVVSDECSSLTSLPAIVVVRCQGDASGDGAVTFLDLNIVLGNFGLSGPGLLGDVNGDGLVNFADLNIVLSNFGRTC